MTKLRTPGTFADVVHRLAAQVGFRAICDEVEKSESLVRKWADPDCPENPTLDQAVILDGLAMREVGQPLFAPLILRRAARLAHGVAVNHSSPDETMWALQATNAALVTAYHEAKADKVLTPHERSVLRGVVEDLRGCCDQIDMALEGPRAVEAAE